MKILHIVQTYVPAYHLGGTIKSVHELNKWLVKKGAEVTVYTTDINGPEDLNVPVNQLVDLDGVKVFYFKHSFPRAWSYSKYLRRALAENAKNFDIIHSTGVFLMAATLGAYYAKKFNKPLIISPRGSLMVEPLKKKSPLKKRIYISLIEKRNLASASVIHFTVDSEKKDYLEDGLPLKKAVVIPNGFDPEEFKEKSPLGFFREKFGISSDKKTILFLSRLSPIKGIDTLIPAFAEVIKKNAEAVLVLAGSDDRGYKKIINQLIKKYNLSRYVIFTGLLIGEDKISAFQDSDVFVLPSYSESFGNVVLEAMYFGLPVVITEKVGIAPSVSRVNAGLVIKKDVNQLAEAILKILNNPTLAEQMGKNGKKLVETEFSWQNIAEEFIKEYDKIIKNY